MPDGGASRPAGGVTCAGAPEVPLPAECALCPRRCGVNRAAGQRGVCGADDTLKLARAALHEWEEPVISVGAGSGTVFFSGCPLRCCYCQNAPISMGGVGRAVTLQQLVDVFLGLQDVGRAANINLVTPTHYAPWVVAGVREARLRGLSVPVVYNTSGYECAQAIRLLEGTVDVYLTDFKYAAPAVSDAAAVYSGAPDYHDEALAALDEMVRQVGAPTMGEYAGDAHGGHAGEPVLARGVIVRHLSLPGRLEESKRLVEELWHRYGNAVLYSFMSQYTPMGSIPAHPELEHAVPASEYEQLLDFADSLGMEDYFWQQGQAAIESFIPSWDFEGLPQEPGGSK